MPSSTTLETLVLEINSSAVKANEGIGRTVGSLRSLARAVGTVLPGLREMNRELLKTSRLKIPNIGGSITRGARKPKTPSVIPETAGKFIPSTPYNLDPKFWNSLDPGSQKVFEKVYRYQYHQQQLADQQRRQAELDARRQKFDESMKNNPVVGTKEMTQAAKDTKETAKGIKAIGDNAQISRPKVSALSRNLSMIGRIFKTMLIRTAIRALMKVARQGLENFYQYSKSINSAYATAIDKLGVSATRAGNQIGASIGTLLTTVAPVLNTILSLINEVLASITALFSLVGGGTTYTKAVDGMNAFAEATTNSGKATKQLLANFDQLNIITSKSNGGNGNSKSMFEGAFTESPIPPWMIEWKPLLEALLAGTLGALVLPAILGGLKKIVGLFATGAGASNLLTFLRYMFRKDTPTFPDIPTGYTNFRFPDQPKYEPFPVQPTYMPFPVAPDYAKAAAEMGALAAAATTALPAVEGIVAALAALSGANVLKDIVALLLTKLAGATMKIEIDRKEYDKFKKEVEDWTKKNGKFSIVIDVVDEGFRLASAVVDAWAENPLVKRIRTMWDNLSFEVGSSIVDSWVKEPLHKYIYTWWNLDGFNFGKSIIDNWMGEKILKIVKAGFDSDAFLNFWKIADAIDAWASETLTKVIKVSIEGDNSGIPKGTSTNPKNSIGYDITHYDFFTGKVEKEPNNLGNILKMLGIDFNANGAYGIPRGDLFVANEAGAELVGSMNGKTTVANQGQIIEGIQKGVRDANADQNDLLRQQNDLLRQILRKKTEFNPRPSAAWGQFISESSDMWTGMTGG